jgi:hypothetical protein
MLYSNPIQFCAGGCGKSFTFCITTLFILYLNQVENCQILKYANAVSRVAANLSIGGIMNMRSVDIDHVCLAVRRGARMLVGRDHAGRQKIKLIKGPFGLFVERFDCNDVDLAVIKSRLAAKTERSKTNAAA